MFRLTFANSEQTRIVFSITFAIRSKFNIILSMRTFVVFRFASPAVEGIREMSLARPRVLVIVR